MRLRSSTIVTAFCWFCVMPMVFVSLYYLWPLLPTSPRFFAFDVAQSSLTELNIKATTNLDGTNNLHHQYNLTINITVSIPDKNYDFMHYNDVKVMAFYRDKLFAMVDLSHFYNGKESTNTIDLLALTHSLIGEYDVSYSEIHHEASSDGLNLSKVDDGKVVSFITEDYMLAELWFSVSPPMNSFYSKEELEYRCKLERRFPLVNGRSVQHANTSSSSESIECEGYLLRYSLLYSFNQILFCFGLVFFVCFNLKRIGDQLDLDPMIDDDVSLKQPLLLRG